MKYALIVISIIVLIFLVMDFNERTVNLNRLTSEKDVISTQFYSRLETKAAVITQIAYATSEAAVREWAYKNSWKKPGDIPVVPIQSTAVTATPTPQPVITTTEVSNLERWLSLFIDQPMP